MSFHGLYSGVNLYVDLSFYSIYTMGHINQCFKGTYCSICREEVSRSV